MTVNSLLSGKWVSEKSVLSFFSTFYDVGKQGLLRGREVIHRRVSSPLSPICSLFQIPTSPLSQKLQQILSELVIPPVVEGQRRPGPTDLPYGITEDQWPIVRERVENHESYRKIAADYGVSRETIRRFVRASKKAG